MDKMTNDSAWSAAFLDRDGVINKDVDFLSSPSDIEILPWAAEAIKRLNEKGIPVVVVTNQSGVARGYFSEMTLADIHEKMKKLLAREGASIDAIYYCPHLPEADKEEYAIECDCRKPAPGMILKAAKELNIDPARSFLVGDSERDIEAGNSAGCYTIMVASIMPEKTAADAVVGNLREAVELVLNGDVKP